MSFSFILVTRSYRSACYNLQYVQYCILYSVHIFTVHCHGLVVHGTVRTVLYCIQYKQPNIYCTVRKVPIYKFRNMLYHNPKFVHYIIQNSIYSLTYKTIYRTLSTVTDTVVICRTTTGFLHCSPIKGLQH